MVWYLAEELSKLSVEDVAWLILAAHCKNWEERDGLREKLLKRREPELMIWETASPPRWQKMLKFRNSLSGKRSRENAESVTLKSSLGTLEDQKIRVYSHKNDSLRD